MPDPTPKPNFFISRTGKDKEWAKWIAQELERVGYTTYLQDWDFLPGQSFPQKMEEALECERTIVVLSQDYIDADYTMPELRAAFTKDPSGKERRFILIRIRRCEIPQLLKQYIYIDFVDLAENQALEALLDGVKGERLKRPVSFPGISPFKIPSADPGTPFPGPKQISVAKLPTVSPILVGREHELAQLDQAWTDPTIRLVSIVAFGGVGKTALALNWWHRNGAPGAVRILGWSFYSQGAAEDRQASADPFLDHALRVWFGVKDPPTDSWQRGEMLADLIRRERTLLILDGLEPIQFPPGPQFGRLKDGGMVALLKELAAHQPGLCACTSRQKLTDLEDYGNAGVLEIDLDTLSPESGAAFLEQLGVKGTKEELEKASRDFDGHALALTLLGQYLVDACDADVRKRDTIPDLFAETEKGGQARRIIRQYELMFRGKPELAILRVLGLFDRPAPLADFEVVQPLSEHSWKFALKRLRDARLLYGDDGSGSLDCHPLVREHFAEEYRTADPEAFRVAHSKLYEHYSTQAPDRPDKLPAMEPLFHAVYHGCQADQHQEVLDKVYFGRILRGDKAHLVLMLGAWGTNLSLLANFFESPWTRLAARLPAPLQYWVVGQVGLALRAVGRLSEAVETMEAAELGFIAAKHWENASINCGSLSQVQLSLGNIVDAIKSAHRSVEYADKSDDAFRPVAVRAILASALHQSGDRIGAATFFEKAERIEAVAHPEAPFLSSTLGFMYRELLGDRGDTSEAQAHATRARPWDTSLLDEALNNISLGHFDDAVNGLRHAGTLDYLPRGLLARAANYRETEEWDKAQHDLEEARILATRCGMRLFLTDYHLEQARLILAQDASNKSAAREHYKKAKQLIKDTGYHRRGKERDELEAALTTEKDPLKAQGI